MFKKISTLCFAVLLAAATCIAPVKAANETINQSQTASLTIYKYDQTAAESAGVNVSGLAESTGEALSAVQTTMAPYALKNIQFNYIKVGSIDSGSKYQITNATVASTLGLTANTYYTPTQINEALATALADTTKKNTLENISGTTAMTKTDTNGKTTATGLAVGLYLVVEKEVSQNVSVTTNPFLVSLPMTKADGSAWNYDVTVYPKNQTEIPTINKMVKQSTESTLKEIGTVSEGDTVDYRVYSKIPSVTTDATKFTKYTFVDKLSAGLTYKKYSASPAGTMIVAIYNTEADAKNAAATAASTLTITTDYTVTYDDANKTMTVAFTASGLSKINAATGKFVGVNYQAVVGSSSSVVLGDAGNDNDVTLSFSRTSTAETGTIKDKARVYSYALKVTKNFSDSAGDATKVQFILRNKTHNKYLTATGGSGVYYVNNDQAAEASATKFVPKADGTLTINGLEADNYELIEVKTAPGYLLSAEPIPFAITATSDTITPSEATRTGIANSKANVTVTAGTRAKATVYGASTTMTASGSSTNAIVPFTVTNNRGFSLPATGKVGTFAVVVFGFLLAGFGTLFIRRKQTN